VRQMFSHEIAHLRKLIQKIKKRVSLKKQERVPTARNPRNFLDYVCVYARTCVCVCVCVCVCGALSF